MVMAVFVNAGISQAHLCDSCSGRAGGEERKQWVLTKQHVKNEFIAHRSFLVSVLWEDNILPAMMMMADQLTAVALQQTMIIGTFFDATHQLETQRALQTIQAQAQKDYHPSVGLCEFGSSIKSLAASERKSEFNAVLLSQRSLDRQLGQANTSATYGSILDKDNRLDQYKSKFCDPTDNNNALWQLCRGVTAPKSPPKVTADKRERYNKDIDYTRTLEAPWTLDVDFTDASTEREEEELMALAANLYSHDLFPRPDPKSLESKEDDKISDIQKRYLDMRALTAKRGVAENSFNAIAALKSSGTAGSKSFLNSLLAELGVEDGEMEELVGENPSYYAQMEVLTKKIYQNPNFYTNLYDKPANVTRKDVALQAIGLMQKFDMFKSYLRSEASLSILLELAVMDLQTEIEGTIGELSGGNE